MTPLRSRSHLATSFPLVSAPPAQSASDAPSSDLRLRWTVLAVSFFLNRSLRPKEPWLCPSCPAKTSPPCSAPCCVWQLFALRDTVYTDSSHFASACITFFRCISDSNTETCICSEWPLRGPARDPVTVFLRNSVVQSLARLLGIYRMRDRNWSEPGVWPLVRFMLIQWIHRGCPWGCDPQCVLAGGQ